MSDLDPAVDTLMTVTLDQLQVCSLNPRIMRNPRFDDIKASIRQRGLDAPLVITRRPGDANFTIRNGGNTRLSILKELWSETREVRFFRIPCQFRPWSTRGEVDVLTGHLAENDIRGGLTFIERALAVRRAREMYEHAAGGFISQAELAQRLSADGYPIAQPLVSRMQDAVEHLLPAIPHLLLAGLGKPQIERLISLRKVARRCWDRYAAQITHVLDFDGFFQEILASFDDDTPARFSVQHVQDELVRQLAELTGQRSNDLALELFDAGIQPPVRGGGLTDVHPIGLMPPECPSTQIASRVESAHVEFMPPPGLAATAKVNGEPVHRSANSTAFDTPVVADGRCPISDAWLIAPGLDNPASLRKHIGQLALEIGSDVHLQNRMEATDSGVGFRCDPSISKAAPSPLPPVRQAALTLFSALASVLTSTPRGPGPVCHPLGLLLVGSRSSASSSNPDRARLTDDAVLKLFRIVRLARRLVEFEPRWEAAGASDDDAGVWTI